MSRRPPNVLPPRDRRWPWIAIAVSTLAHVLLVLIRIGPWLPPPRTAERRIIFVPLGTEGPKAVDMAYRPEPSSGAAKKRPPTSGISVVPEPETGPEVVRREPDTATVTAQEPEDTSSVPGARGPGRSRINGPALGEGKLWVRPLPLPPQDLARALTKTHVELVDSAVTAIVQAYIDSVLNGEPDNAPLPSWTTKVGDQQIGLDSRWIYLGPIKIPTALVAAFLPLNGGSAEQSDYTRFRQLQQMREDVQMAARRAQTMDDFKRAIKELREQREREREFAKNQRTRPTPPPKKADSTVVKVP